MKHSRFFVAALLFGVLLTAPILDAQRPGGQRNGSRGPDGPKRERPSDIVEVPTDPSIAWFGTWEAGLREAERTGRPILLMSAAPQCHGVPGMW